MKSFVLSCLLLLSGFGLYAQVGRDTLVIKKELDTLNRQIDHWVVQKKIEILQKYYADDFVFTHGTGHVDSKESWLKAVGNPKVEYVSRIHDSTAVELHKQLAIVTGTLTVNRKVSSGVNRYAVRYVRVYALQQKDWQMVSHRTMVEWRF